MAGKPAAGPSLRPGPAIPFRRIDPMHNIRDLLERALVFLLLLMALSGIAFGVANMAGAGPGIG